MSSVLDSHIVAARSDPLGSEKSLKGLKPGHYYSVIGAYEVMIKKEPVQLIKLRDSWSNSDYKGDWANDDPRWSDKLKSKLGFSEYHDGTFYMDAHTFKQVFSDFTIAFLKEDWAVSYIEGIDTQVQDNRVTFEFEMPELSEAFLEFYINPPRMFPPSCMGQFPTVLFELFHQDGTRKDHKEQEVTDGYINMRILDLEAGKYIAKIKVFWTQSLNREYTFRIYSPYSIVIKDNGSFYSEDAFQLSQVFNN